MYRPAVMFSLLIAVLALGLAAVQPPPLLFALAVFAAMSVQWIVMVIRWLDTPEGLAKTAEFRGSPI